MTEKSMTAAPPDSVSESRKRAGDDTGSYPGKALHPDSGRGGSDRKSGHCV